jgi:hypothetical protein
VDLLSLPSVILTFVIRAYGGLASGHQMGAIVHFRGELPTVIFNDLFQIVYRGEATIEMISNQSSEINHCGWV